MSLKKGEQRKFINIFNYYAYALNILCVHIHKMYYICVGKGIGIDTAI